MPKTQTGESLKKYIRGTLSGAQKAGQQAIKAGYPKLSTYTKKYLSQLPKLKKYGDKEQKQALKRAGDLYKDYKKAGKYKEVDFSGIKKLYRAASDYDKTEFSDFERKYGKAGKYDKTSFADLGRKYKKAGEYDKTKFSDIEKMYGKAGKYDAGKFTKANYKTKNIQERMTPYEKLVSAEAEKRLKKGYNEARKERESQAVRAGAFGGSGAAIQEEVARRNYLEQAAQMNAQNLQSAYESAVNLYGKEVADRLNSEQLTEASRQFAKQTQLSGIEGLMGARQQTAAQVAAAKQAELAGLSGEMGAREQTAAQVAAAKQAELAGIEGAMAARGMTAEQIAAAKQAELAGISGMLSAQQQTAAQRAAAKEAEFAGLQGQSEQARQQALLAEQQKNMQLTNLAALQKGGQYQQDYNLAQRMYPLDVYARQSAIMGGMSGGYSPLPTAKQDNSSLWGNIIAGATTGVGFLQGLSDLRRGGLVYRGGGLADLEPEYYDQYER